MKRNNFIIILVLLIACLVVVSCNITTQEPQLTLTNMTKDIPSEGGTVTLSFTCNGAWSVDTTGLGWLKLSQISGVAGDAAINLIAPSNSSGISRSVLLYVISPNGQARRVTALQLPNLFPSYNTSSIAPDASGMSSTAAQLANKIKLGINIGNTMEIGSYENGNNYGNPLITQLLIDSIKKAGFTAIRIPVEYDYSHIINKATAQIDPVWLNRVKEVVQYCVNDGIYAVINIHWDGGWLDCNATGAKLDSIKAKQKAYWEQIATTMRDFDEHLLFASANEPFSETSNFSFTLPTITNLYDFHQIFIDAVRSTGGKNAYRNLVIQAPVTSGDLANYFAPGSLPGMPSDNVANKLVLEFHYYSPYNFCLNDDLATQWYYWGANFHSTTDLARNATSDTEETYVDAVFSRLQKEFASNGIPVLVGEMGAFSGGNAGLTGNALTLHLASRGHWYSYVAHSALKHGALPFIWDTGEMFSRTTGAVQNKQILDSLKYAVSN